MVMVTDISDQERVQIVKSRWNAAFPDEEGAGDEEVVDGKKGGGDTDKKNVGGSGAGGGDMNGSSHKNNGKSDTHSNGDQMVTRDLRRSLTKTYSVRPSSNLSAGLANRSREIQSQELKTMARRRRFTMFSTDGAAEEFSNARRARRLGIRTSMDFSGMLLDAYSTMDQLQQHAVLEAMMNVADVAHTMQSFAVFVKWNRRLYKEFYIARLRGRLSFNPSENWYGNQIGFFQHYIIPLSRKLKTCGVFGTTGDIFEYFATENKKRWMEEGELISEEIIREVKEEVEREQCILNGCH